MASLHPPALLPPLCCSSQAFLDPRTRGPPPRFSNGTCSMARPSGRSEFLGKGGALTSRTVARRRLRLGVSGAGRGPFFGGGGRRMNRGTSRVVGNLAFAALLTYLAVTGQLRWVLDAIVSLWCPNCGKSFQILKSALKDGPQLCPYCTQPFSVQGKKFVRESARFSSGRGPTATTAQVFNELFTRGTKGKAPSGTIVDVEAEVKDAE
ncbi:hypothetical protein PR202_ga05587 [Eleusine coracana subsp. coracana]|uniref:Uncharacterized protein n=1 Tax=Eleusine coracana subsp. coracana TaxID=191504 RepID=A0AAV5BUK4_ELECO|nr:hypothetical protein PR202_ga05133 [Eleusine coracana subsp. coracana]GJM89395.1 hypothetical protein PR202_ga05587 [Eleusine coracana subsp. coracana]